MRILIVLVAFLSSEASSAKLPPTFPKCDHQAADFQQCMHAAIQNAISQLNKPFKSVGLPSLEPLEVSSFSISGGHGPVKVVQNFQHAKLYGLSRCQIKTTNFAFAEKSASLNVTLLVPELRVVSEYDLNGRVLLMPIVGRGNATIILENVTGMVYIYMEIISKHGNGYLHISDHECYLPKIGLLQMNFENLYEGNKQLSDAMNKTLNENWEAVFEDVRSGYEAFICNIIAHFGNQLFGKVPLHELIYNTTV